MPSVSTHTKYTHLSIKSSKEVDNACVIDCHRYETSVHNQHQDSGPSAVLSDTAFS